jgi:acyl carrier protein
MNDLKQALRSFVIETFLFGQDPGLTDSSSFLASGVIDSTGVLELVAHVEAFYSLKIRDDELLPENLDSIDAIAAFVQRKRGVG